MCPSIDSVTKEQVLTALANGELRLYYQPLYNFRTKQFEAVEALLRWQHPKEGLLLPEVFLPHLDAIGVSLILGSWVLNQACEQFHAWVESGVNIDRVAVNLHRQQWYEKDFVDQVTMILKAKGMAAHQLELEITEDIPIHQNDQCLIETIKRLRSLGVRIALDDFGRGYSNATHLQYIHVDHIKIDKAYVAHDALIVENFIKLAEHYHLGVVIEGVESYQQLMALLSNEGLIAQGHYFSEAVSAEDAGEFLRYYQQHPFPLVG
jgi:EAL domain-containing protein (putative c-di-GMP-specific phosphodiesterase class I)